MLFARYVGYLRILAWYLSQKVENGGANDGIDAEEEVDAHIGDEGFFYIFKEPC